MKLRGKIGLWWLALMLFINVYLIYLMSQVNTIAGGVILISIIIVLNIFMVSWTLKNYIILNSDHFTIHFGFSTKNVMYKDVVKISQTKTLIAGSALSFDRLMIETFNEIMIVSLKEKEIFITEVMKRNKEISLT
jgi:signal transduction histidine kinase